MIYSEIDPHAAEWLRGLVREGLIAPGRVIEGDIHDLEAIDVQDAAQFHAFAGIGGWAYALRLAGWPTSFPVWTGSCPCQPFSGAGKGGGFEDPRHLWPEWRRLIEQCHPPIVFGEQVASPPGRKWLALVRSEMEDLGYAFGAADLCAAGVGAPHARQRLFFGAVRVGFDPEGERRHPGALPFGGGEEFALTRDAGAPRELAHHASPGREGRTRIGLQRLKPSPGGGAGGVAHRDVQRREGLGLQPQRRGSLPALFEAPGGGEAHKLGDAHGAGLAGRADERRDDGSQFAPVERASGGILGGHWADAEWLPCSDGKHRPAKPGAFPLAYGVSGRMVTVCALGDHAEVRAPHRYNRAGALKGIGNAIVPQVAAEFVLSFMAALGVGR